MPAHKKLTDAGRARIEEVARIRDETPTDKELARECGVSPHTVRHEMEDYRRNGIKPTTSQDREAVKEARPVAREMFHGSAPLWEVVEKVQQDHVDRLDGPQAETLVPRSYRPKRRPKTAIIALAAQRAIAKRESREKASQDMRKWLTSALPADETVEPAECDLG